MLLFVLVCSLLAGPAVAADDDERIADLERQVRELQVAQAADDAREAAQAGSQATRSSNDWTRYVRLGGSLNTGWYGAKVEGDASDNAFQIRDARFFVDAELGEGLELAGHTLIRNAGMSFEWNLVRIGTLFNNVGDLYIDLQGIADSPWVNLQVGRFQIPVGEAYLRYSQGYWKNPFISNPVAGTWWWDEGVKLYGGDERGRFSYVASITENETSFNSSVSGQKQYTLKLITDPTPWLRVSGSFVYAGRNGSETDPGSGGGLWIGETWARGIGVNSSVPVYQDGVQVADGPNDVDRSWFGGADVIVDLPEKGRLWLSYGGWRMVQTESDYDRQIHSWIAELVLYGSLLTPALDGLYLGGRASGIGTYDADQGYSLDFRTLSQYGYNMRSLQEYSVVIGWRPVQYVVVRTEYSRSRVEAIRGVPVSIMPARVDIDAWGVEVAVHF
jgi:hypothetical protein